MTTIQYVVKKSLIDTDVFNFDFNVILLHNCTMECK